MNLQLLSNLRHGMSNHDLACRQAAVAKYFVSVLVAMWAGVYGESDLRKLGDTG